MTAPLRPQVKEITPIPKKLLPKFQAWLKANRVTDLDNPNSFYDYRGAFMAGISRDPVGGHFPDTFKQHGHPTFSVESQYAKPNDPTAGRWEGENFILPPKPTPQRAVQFIQRTLRSALVPTKF